MVFTLVLLMLGGLFVVGYGVWVVAESRSNSRTRNASSSSRRRQTDTSSDARPDMHSLLFLNAMSHDNTSSSGSPYPTDASYDSSSSGSCDSGGSDSSSSSSCDSDGGSSSSD
jgi:hypothetical protein